MVTQPLELESHLRPPPRNFDVFFYVDIALIAIFFSLMGSQFVLAPGMPMSLPVVQGSTELARPADLVVSMRGDNIVLFEGGLFPLAGFERRIAAVVKARNAETVLVRVDRQVSAQALLYLCTAARSAGAKHVQIAAEEAFEQAP